MAKTGWELKMANTRKFNGKLFSYVGWAGNKKRAMEIAKELRHNGLYSVRTVKVKDGYNFYSRKR